MFAEPTINDFLDRLRWHLDKAADSANRAVAQVWGQAAKVGALQSGSTIILTLEAVRREFHAGIEAALRELKQATIKTNLDKNELRQHTVQCLENFLITAKAATKSDQLRSWGAAKHVDEQLAQLDRDLNFSVRQFDVGFLDPSDSKIPIDEEPQPVKLPVEVPPLGQDIFVVHGRDEAAKIEVARLIERAGLTAVILHEQPNAGRTIIEKFEQHGGSAGFAVIVLTPDDVGGIDADHLRVRARQNVIGEMFWFAGRLGRKRVCALKKGDIEMPSDFAGVGYTEMDGRGAWKAELLKELDAAGYEIDYKKALA